MSISANVKKSVENISSGQVFSYCDFPDYQQVPSAVVKAMGRLVNDGGTQALE